MSVVLPSLLVSPPDLVFKLSGWYLLVSPAAVSLYLLVANCPIVFNNIQGYKLLQSVLGKVRSLVMASVLSSLWSSLKPSPEQPLCLCAMEHVGGVCRGVWETSFVECLPDPPCRAAVLGVRGKSSITSQYGSSIAQNQGGWNLLMFTSCRMYTE